MMAFLVLQASFNQKYGLDVTGVHAKIAKRFADAGLKPGIKAPLPPMTDDLRAALRAELVPQLQTLSAAQLTTLGIEQRWLEKIANAVHGGKLKRFANRDCIWTPTTSLRSHHLPQPSRRWMPALDIGCNSVLNLLERGHYSQPYSPLAEMLAAARDGDEKAEKILMILTKHVASTSTTSPTED